MTQNTSKQAVRTLALAILCLTVVLLSASSGAGRARPTHRMHAQSRRHVDGAGDPSRLHDQRSAGSAVQLARHISW